MDFLQNYHLLGLIIGLGTFLIIGIFHPIVIKAEYHLGTKCWWGFMLAGIVAIALTMLIDNVLVSALLGVTRKNKSPLLKISSILKLTL